MPFLFRWHLSNSVQNPLFPPRELFDGSASIEIVKTKPVNIKDDIYNLPVLRSVQHHLWNFHDILFLSPQLCEKILEELHRLVFLLSHWNGILNDFVPALSNLASPSLPPPLLITMWDTIHSRLHATSTLNTQPPYSTHNLHNLHTQPPLSTFILHTIHTTLTLHTKAALYTQVLCSRHNLYALHTTFLVYTQPLNSRHNHSTLHTFSTLNTQTIRSTYNLYTLHNHCPCHLVPIVFEVLWDLD